MASRTKQEAEARARRVGEEKAQLERERRRQRVLVLSGVVLGAVVAVAVAVAVAIVISSGGGGSTGLKSGSGEAKMAAQIRRLLGGIRQSGATLGYAKAPVTMTYNSDLHCPVCADFTPNSGFPELIAKDVRAGKVRIVYRAFETATRDPQTFQTQQVAALAAGEQNHFWDYSALIKQVQSEQQAARAAGLQGTPTLIFQGPRGKAQSPAAAPSYDQLEQVMKSVA